MTAEILLLAWMSPQSRCIHADGISIRILLCNLLLFRSGDLSSSSPYKMPAIVPLCHEECTILFPPSDQSPLKLQYAASFDSSWPGLVYFGHTRIQNTGSDGRQPFSRIYNTFLWNGTIYKVHFRNYSPVSATHVLGARETAPQNPPFRVSIKSLTGQLICGLSPDAVISVNDWDCNQAMQLSE